MSALPPEPTATTHLRALLRDDRQHLTGAPARATAAGAFDRVVMHALRHGPGDAASLRAQAHAHARRTNRRLPDADRLDGVPGVLAHAAIRPAVVSAVLWSWLGDHDAPFASHLVELVRERADLPGQRGRLDADEPSLRRAGASLAALAVWFAERQVADACAWIARLPPPLGVEATLAQQRAAVEQARAAAPRPSRDEVVTFARQAARFLVQLSAQRLDPLGFPLAREVQLDVDPAPARRLELTRWARRAGHLICPRGEMIVTSLAVASPWPLRLELIVAELGRGTCGGLGLLVRLDAGGSFPTTTPAPVLLLLPGESLEERGQRFELWLADAYPHATGSWHPWS